MSSQFHLLYKPVNACVSVRTLLQYVCTGIYFGLNIFISYKYQSIRIFAYIASCDVSTSIYFWIYNVVSYKEGLVLEFAYYFTIWDTLSKYPGEIRPGDFSLASPVGKKFEKCTPVINNTTPGKFEYHLPPRWFVPPFFKTPVKFYPPLQSPVGFYQNPGEIDFLFLSIWC